MTVAEYGEIVAALRAVPGVADADVEPDTEGGSMGLLRLGLTPGYDEVQVATSVGRLLRERFGLGVDAERVQLVEEAEVHDPVAPAYHGNGNGHGASDPDAGSPDDAYAHDAYAHDADAADAADAAHPNGADANRHRPAIQRMHLVSSGLDITASVTLSMDGRSETGTATGTATQTGVQRAVALATLRACELLADERARFELDHLDVAPTGRDRTVVVGLTLVTSSATERLTGAAVVREDVRQAVIRATLDGLNRRFATLLAD